MEWKAESRNVERSRVECGEWMEWRAENGEWRLESGEGKMERVFCVSCHV